jgi:hypothetical protein
MYIYKYIYFVINKFAIKPPKLINLNQLYNVLNYIGKRTGKILAAKRAKIYSTLYETPSLIIAITRSCY